MIAVQIDDDIADIVKKAAKDEHRTIKGQMRHYLEQALKSEGRIPNHGNKKAEQASLTTDCSASV